MFENMPDVMGLLAEQAIREKQREMRRLKIEAKGRAACALSKGAHYDALSRGERPGPGWWEVAGGRYPRWRGEKLVMRYRLPEAKRAREGGE